MTTIETKFGPVTVEALDGNRLILRTEDMHTEGSTGLMVNRVEYFGRFYLEDYGSRGFEPQRRSDIGEVHAPAEGYDEPNYVNHEALWMHRRGWALRDNEPTRAARKKLYKELTRAARAWAEKAASRRDLNAAKIKRLTEKVEATEAAATEAERALATALANVVEAEQALVAAGGAPRDRNYTREALSHLLSRSEEGADALDRRLRYEESPTGKGALA